MSTTYINTTCKVGQGEPCGREATYVIAVTEVADTAWATEGRTGGVVGLCEYHASKPVAEWTEDERERRNKGLADYLRSMDRAGGGIYTRDFRDGFRHALAMLAAFESDEPPNDRSARPPEVREAARQALAARDAAGRSGGEG